ncbi:hypothetical protein HWV62_4547 [Athelia sp. TMB]|nr:hypothetical protein HWV62_4547 [Athelia sp. TMB]
MGTTIRLSYRTVSRWDKHNRSNARAREPKDQTSKGRSFQLASRLTTRLASSALWPKHIAAHTRPCFWVHTARGIINVWHWGSTPSRGR